MTTIILITLSFVAGMVTQWLLDSRDIDALRAQDAGWIGLANHYLDQIKMLKAEIKNRDNELVKLTERLAEETPIEKPKPTELAGDK